MRRFLLFLFLIPTALTIRAQNPLVTEKFDQLYIGENFDSSNSYWSTISNLDNLLIVQEGEYIMQRKASFSPYAVMASFPSTLSNYRLVTSIKLDKSSAVDGSIGLIFMAQDDGKGGFIFEINKEQQYRLRQITNTTYNYLTGSAQEGGWVKNDLVKVLNMPNLIELRTADKKYDLYINNTLVLSFEELTYKAGNVGFIIGPASKGKADFLYLFTRKGTESIESNSESATEENTSPETDIIALAESIITLKTQINKLHQENEDLKGIIEGMKSGEKEQESVQAKYEKYIKELEGKLKNSSASFDSLLRINTELNKYKEMVKGNDNGDLVINLSKNLKNEKTTNESLRAVNKAQADSILLLKNQLKDFKGKPGEASNVKQKQETSPSEKNPSKGEFILPKEN